MVDIQWNVVLGIAVAAFAGLEVGYHYGTKNGINAAEKILTLVGTHTSILTCKKKGKTKKSGCC